MRTIRLYGALADRTGYSFLEANVSTVADAVRCLIANWPELEALICSHDWSLFAGTHNLGQEELHHPVGRKEDIHLIPIIAGSGAAGRIVGGILLVAASFFVPGVALAGVALGPVLFGVGVSLALGGVAQLLSPKVPTQQREKDPQEVRSYSISGVQLTSRQGTPVPVCYGEIVTGAIVISAGITTSDLPGVTSSRSRSYGAARPSGKGGKG